MTYTIYFDLETGGVQPHHPTIQLAAVAVDEQWQEVASMEVKIAFDEATADPEALAMNGYTAEAWSDAISERSAAQKFAAFVRPYSSIPMVSKRTGKPYSVAKLAGYNAVSFDLPRLKALFGTEFLPWSYLVRDVLQRVLFYFDERANLTPPENFKLSTVCGYFSIDTEGAHDALADTRMAVKLARAMSQEVCW